MISEINNNITSFKRKKVVVEQFIDGLGSSTFTMLKTHSPPALPTEIVYASGKVPINVKKDLQALKPYLVAYEESYDTEAERTVERVYEDK